MRICGRRRASRSTRTCAPRAGRARWSARSTDTWPTTSGGPRPGSSRRCSRRGRSQATPTWARPTPRPSRRWCGRPRAGPTSSPTCRPCAAASRSTCARTTPTASSSSAAAGCATSSSPSSCSSSCTAAPTPRSGSPTTLDALATLVEPRYVGRDDGANLAASYRFLRAAGAPAAAAAHAPHPSAARRGRHGRAALARARRQAAARRAARRRRGPDRGVAAQRPARPPPAREAVLPAAARRGVAGVRRGPLRGGRDRPARRAGLGVARGRAAPHPGADGRGVAGGRDPEGAAAGAARRARPHPGPGPRAAGLPPRVRGARPHPLVPAPAAGRGSGRRAADAAAGHRPRWFRTCSCGPPRCCGCSPRRSPASPTS